MRFALMVCLVVLCACGRPLTQNEAAFARMMHGETLDIDRVRIVEGAPTRAVTFRRKPRPRTTCRERIMPPIKSEIVTSKPAAMTVYNHVLFDKDWYLEDYLPGYPDQVGLVAAMLFAHEITHVWQWQNRAITGYSPRRAAKEHQVNDDPYRFDISTQSHFLEYGYEQQASIVEEYLCCALLDPDAPRTHRLKAMLQEVMPLSSLPTPMTVQLPWKGVELEGICH